MPRITLVVKSQINTRTQLLSAQELKDNYLFGIKIQKDGKDLPDSAYDKWIAFAIKEVERHLSIKLKLQIFTENKDFYYSDWMEWCQVKATYPIHCMISMEGFIANTKQVTYPREWLTVYKSSGEELFSRLVHVLPNSSSTFHQTAALYTGFFPNWGSIGGGKHTPEYWTLSYITGFKKIPEDILQAIGMLASINILTVANETLASAMGALGGNSRSISLDGLSQSTSLYINGQTGIFGARIKQYVEMLRGKDGSGGLMKELKDFYGDILWTTL